LDKINHLFAFDVAPLVHALPFAYLVFNNKTLKELVLRMPRTEREASSGRWLWSSKLPKSWPVRSGQDSASLRVLTSVYNGQSTEAYNSSSQVEGIEQAAIFCGL